MKILTFWENTNDFEVVRCGEGDNDFYLIKKAIITVDRPILESDISSTMHFENYVFRDFSLISWWENDTEYHIKYSSVVKN